MNDLRPFIGADGEIEPGALESIDGFVRVDPEHIIVYGASLAIAIGLLRNWWKHPQAIRAKDGSFQVVLAEIARAAGVCPKTFKRALDRLSTGSHRDHTKKPPTHPYCGRLVVVQKRGYASFVRLLSASEQRDWQEQRASPPRVSAPTVTNAEQEAAKRAREQPSPHAPPKEELDQLLASLKRRGN